jgi:hypothetical protein
MYGIMLVLNFFELRHCCVRSHFAFCQLLIMPPLLFGNLCFRTFQLLLRCEELGTSLGFRLRSVSQGPLVSRDLRREPS